MVAGGYYDVVLLALARDCAGTLPANLAGLQRLRDDGLRVHAMIGENGSRDGTRGLLDTAAADGDLTVVDTSAMSAQTPRLRRMAVGRELVADALAATGITAPGVAVIDLDEPFLAALSTATLSSALARLEARRSELFALAATSRPTYYDLLAYEDDNRSFVGLDERIAQLQRHPIGYYRLFRDEIYPTQRLLTATREIACTSAFNGMCLYAGDIYRKGSYLAAATSPLPCEHVVLNRSLRHLTGRHMAVDPQIVLPMPAEHGPRSMTGFAWQRASRLPRLIRRHSPPAPADLTGQDGPSTGRT